MQEHHCSMNRYEGHHHHHAIMIFHLIIPLAVSFMIGMHKGMRFQKMWSANNSENGVPPILAELHRRAHANIDQPAGSEA